MFARRMLFIPTLLAAGAVPYAVFDGRLASLTSGNGPSWFGADSQQNEYASLSDEFTAAWENPAGQPAYQADGGLSSLPPAAPRAAPRLAGPAVHDLRDVLRFDIEPRWVINHWSRVSTTLAELELEGLRVPLVTGTGVDDIAGSLTYYFDKQQQVQRITLHGTTGDERKLVAMLVESCGFRPEPTLGAGLYLTRWNGQPTSALRVNRAPVMRASSPRTQLEISLEINRPSPYYGLSGEFRDVLERDRQARRWP